MGTPLDLHTAAAWYNKAALQGHAQAQFNLSVALDCGMGIEIDQLEASRLRRAAAISGNSAAQYHLGVLAERDANSPEALWWYRRAANQGCNVFYVESHLSLATTFICFLY